VCVGAGVACSPSDGESEENMWMGRETGTMRGGMQLFIAFLHFGHEKCIIHVE